MLGVSDGKDGANGLNYFTLFTNNLSGNVWWANNKEINGIVNLGTFNSDGIRVRDDTFDNKFKSVVDGTHGLILTSIG